MNNPLTHIDPDGWWTINMPVSLNVSSMFNQRGSGSLSLIFDNHGNWAILKSSSVTLTSGGMSITLTGGVQWTSADTIWDVLHGGSPNIQFTVSAGDGIIGGAVNGTVNTGGNYWGFGFSAGTGGGFSISGSVGIQTEILMSNESLSQITDIDKIMYGMLLTGKINEQTYVDYYINTDINGIDPSQAFFWVIYNMSSGDN
jgi:hypothetical protein